jgi:hypothetical protein
MEFTIMQVGSKRRLSSDLLLYPHARKGRDEG